MVTLLHLKSHKIVGQPGFIKLYQRTTNIDLVFSDKLIVAHIVNKCLDFYGIRIFIQFLLRRNKLYFNILNNFSVYYFS